MIGIIAQARRKKGSFLSYLGTLDAPLAERIERRLRAFHAALERHPRQLREHSLEEYLAIKRPDVSRVAQQARR